MDDEKIDIHGRVFQKISIVDRIYLAPIASDDREEDRLMAQHDILFRLFGNRLFSRNIPVTNPRRILDCGYGTGDWSVQCAEEFDECKVRTHQCPTKVAIHWADLPLRKQQDSSTDVSTPR